MSSKEYELWNSCGKKQKEQSIELGPHSSFKWNNSPRQMIFTAVRYKFAAKIFGNGVRKSKSISLLDLGCSDGYGTHFLTEVSSNVLGMDFDEDAIIHAQKEQNENIRFVCGDFLGEKIGLFDGIVSFDVLEHIYPENEILYMNTVLDNLSKTGTFVIGTPSKESQMYSKKIITDAHVNLYTGEKLYEMLTRYFSNVYIFTQNDEIVHTGHLRMANYLIAVCTGKGGES